MSIDRFSPALRRAVMKACPSYFGLSQTEQELFRAKLTSEDELIIDRQLYADLFDLSVSTREEARDAHGDLNPHDVNRFNEAVLPLQGVGDDCFWLNESFDDESTHDFETLHDYDLSDHEFQEDCRQKEDPDRIRKPYRGSLYAAWARLFVDDVFTYATLFCAAGYLLTEIEDHGRDVLDRLIPHRYVRGENDGKPEAGGFLMDSKLDAGGREEQFRELRDRFWGYQKQRYKELLDLWDAQALGRVWIIDDTKPDDPAMTVVFSDKTALRDVRLRHFMADCRAMKGDNDVLATACEEERRRVADFLEEQHADIEANFDPKIHKLRKKRKIIVTPEALDDLKNLSD